MLVCGKHADWEVCNELHFVSAAIHLCLRAKGPADGIVDCSVSQVNHIGESKSDSRACRVLAIWLLLEPEKLHEAVDRVMELVQLPGGIDKWLRRSPGTRSSEQHIRCSRVVLHM